MSTVREGLYRVQFRTREDTGSGVAVLRDGRFLGGDSSCQYVGRYEEAHGRIRADLTIEVHTFVGWMIPVLLQERAEISLEGEVAGERITLRGAAETASRTHLEVEMEFRAAA